MSRMRGKNSPAPPAAATRRAGAGSPAAARPAGATASEQQLGSVLASLQGLLFVFDEHGVYIDFQTAEGGHLLLRNPSEFLGKRYDQVGLPPEVVRQTADALASLRASDRAQTFDYALDLPQGKLWFHARLTRWVNSRGGYAGAVAIVTDITDYVRAEEESRARSRQLEAVAILGGSALAGAEPRKLMNEAVGLVKETLGTDFSAVLEVLPDRDELLLCAGVGWREGLVGSLTLPSERRSLAGYAIATGTPVIVEDLKQETRFEVSPVLHEHGVVSVIAVVIRIGTELYGVLSAHTRQRREFSEQDAAFLHSVANLLATGIQRGRAGAALRESEGRFRHLLRSIPDLVWSSTLDSSRLLYINDAVESIYGVSRGDFERNPRLWYDVVHPEDRTRVEEEARRLLPEGSLEMEYRIVRPDGEVRWLYDRSAVVHDEAGAPLRLGGIVSDVTELKRLEEELRQAQKMEAVGRLAGGVAHDFNNLLTAILGYCQVALERLGPEDPVRKDVEEVLKAGERASDLTQKLLAFGRKQMLQPRILDLNHAVSDMGRLLERLIGEDIHFVTRLEAGEPWVRADAGQIEQILMNLAVNARDAMPAGGTLTIETTNIDRQVVLTVSDTGTGMDRETLSRVFEPFFTTKERGRGTGLGLATVYGIVKQSGGEVTVSSSPGAGTEFRISFPHVEAPLAEAPTAQRVVLPVPGSGTVLLVEDEVAVRELIHSVLEANGYRVLTARDPHDALRLGEGYAGSLDLLITDVIMPGLNGRDLAARITSLRPGLRVLYISGYSEEILEGARVSGGGTAYLQKPFGLGALAAAVRDAMA